MYIRAWVTVLVVCCLHSNATADLYYAARLGDLEIVEGTLPSAALESFWLHGVNRSESLRPLVVLDGPGEAYLHWSHEFQRNEVWTLFGLRVDERREVTGRLFVPREDMRGMQAVTFKVPSSALSDKDRKQFLQIAADYYRTLLERGAPGGAWFRHRLAELHELDASLNTFAPNGPNRFTGRPSEIEDTYNLFVGGRAISENLQLDRLMPPEGPSKELVRVDSLNGITVAEMDWQPLVKDLKPRLDALARFIPADQHALFFPSFQSMVAVMDEADTRGTPLLRLMEPRAEDARAKDRYERQLCLGISALGRLLGPQVISSIAFTGSDPYLREGSDVAVLFEAKGVDVLKQFLVAKHAAALRENSSAEAVSGQVAGVSWSGVVSPDRAVSSYLMVIDNLVTVSNSVAQLERLALAAQGKSPALAGLREYSFFRDRYKLGDPEESALLILSDATIRRWCGPRWRIAASRRLRAAAVLAELEAQSLEELAGGDVKARLLETSAYLPDPGQLRLEAGGVRSTTYGSIEFLTPIAEMKLEEVTRGEAEMYSRWRDGYQQNWSRYFDPVALRLSLRDGKLGGDLTVMPLIASTEYREFIEVSSGAKIAPDDGDRHAGTLFHVIVSVNPESRWAQQAGMFASGWMPGLKQPNPLAWIGSSISLFADADPVWEVLQKAMAENEIDSERRLFEMLPRLPIGLRIEIRNPLGATLFLAALRGFIDQTAPQMTVWESLEHNGQAFVKITPRRSEDSGVPEELENLAVYYSITPKALLVTLHDGLLKRALDRQALAPVGGARKVDSADTAGKPAQPRSRPWLGENLCLQAERAAAVFLEFEARREFNDRLRELSFANLPILNEWRRRFGARDPVAFHERHWGVRLECPGGGSYVWNEDWQTMESTVFGHPGQPKEPAGLPWVADGLRHGNFGLTFEHQGLRARAEIETEPKRVGGAR